LRGPPEVAASLLHLQARDGSGWIRAARNFWSVTDYANGWILTESASAATSMPELPEIRCAKQGRRAPVRTGSYDWFAGF